MRAQIKDRVILAAALAAALGSFGWFGWPGRAQGRARVLPSSVKLAATYLSAGVTAPTMPRGEWLPPSPQARGAEWIYDVFTPPEVYFDEAAQKFAVVPRDPPEAEEPELQAQDVPRTPFPLQLVGYVGEAGRFLGTFEIQPTGEVFLAGRGRVVPALGLVITEFTVEKQPVQLADNLVSDQWVATAVVRDQLTGGDVSLRAGERSYLPDSGALSAGEDEEYDSTPR